MIDRIGFRAGRRVPFEHDGPIVFVSVALVGRRVGRRVGAVDHRQHEQNCQEQGGGTTAAISPRHRAFIQEDPFGGCMPCQPGVPVRICTMSV